MSNPTFGFLAAIATVAALAANAAVPVFRDVTPAGLAPAGSQGGGIVDVLVHPLDGNRLLVIESARLHETRDAGESWQLISSQDIRNSGSYFVHPGRPGRIYRQSGGTGFTSVSFNAGTAIYRSDDFGSTWTSTTQGYPQSDHAILPLAVDPANTEHVFALLRSGTIVGAQPFGSHGHWEFSDAQIVETFDGGKDWSGVLLATPSFGATGMHSFEAGVPAAPNRFFITTNDNRSFLSTDAGRHWSAFEIAGAGPVQWVEQDPLDAAILYAATGNLAASGRTTVQRSDDGGRTWQEIYVAQAGATRTTVEPRLVIDPAKTDRLWLFGLEAGVLLSEDRGATWSSAGFAVDPTNPGWTIVYRLVPSPADLAQVFLLWNGRLYRGVLPPRQRVAVEYQYGDRFWITGDTAEAQSQDYRANEAFRTGQRFGLWSAATAPAGAVPFCRFQGNPAREQTSRFLTLEGSECGALRGDPAWALEGQGEYFAVPTGPGGQCVAGLVAVTRFVNGLHNANHRYVVDPQVANEMRARRWIREGVAFCARALGSNE